MYSKHKWKFNRLGYDAGIRTRDLSYISILTATRPEGSRPL